MQNPIIKTNKNSFDYAVKSLYVKDDAPIICQNRAEKLVCVNDKNDNCCEVWHAVITFLKTHCRDFKKS